MNDQQPIGEFTINRKAFEMAFPPEVAKLTIETLLKNGNTIKWDESDPKEERED